MGQSLTRPGGALWAATLAACLVAGCNSSEDTNLASGADCNAAVTPIAAIQGDQFDSSMIGREVTVRAVVTLVSPEGVYIESLQPDDSDRTSEGLFVQTASKRTDFQPGQVIQVSGQVAELGEVRDTMTSLVGADGWSLCGSQKKLPQTTMHLPMAAGARESLEAMRLDIRQPLALSDVYELRFGKIRVSAGTPLPAPTEVARPGNDARQQSKSNRDQSIYVLLDNDQEPDWPVGSLLNRMTGVLGHGERGPLLLLETDVRVTAPPLLKVPAPAGNDLRVVSMNLHNYFNGNGRGGGFPTERGAETAEEYQQQRQRLVGAIREIQPHIVAVMELENDGFDKGSAAYDFSHDLREATGAAWQVVGQGLNMIGTDQITVGLFYREDQVSPVGKPQLKLGGPFQWGNRVPLAQLFQHRASGSQFLVVVNHLKSKGSCPEEGPNTNQQDGQACWNPTRTSAVHAINRWVKALASGPAEGNALVLGDFNAYRMEDPIQAFINHGWVDLTASTGPGHGYSYLYRGESGTLDYAFASKALSSSVWKAKTLHINAAFPPGIDLHPGWLRYSDHDPVMVDLRFRQSSTMD